MLGVGPRRPELGRSQIMNDKPAKEFDPQGVSKQGEAVANSPGRNGEEALNPGPVDGLGDGRLPAELRSWVLEQFPEDQVLRSLNELNGQECPELSGFLDLTELERAVTSEKASRQR